jgi:PAS domain S-box-containing protein
MTDSNKGLRILIVEDDSEDQDLITELLDASVIKIQLLITAETLGKAIDILQKETFDIILLDLALPDSSGISTFKTVKKFAGKVPVIILSGLIDMNFAVEAIALGAQDYLLKEDIDEKVLTKSIVYSIERKKNLENLPESELKYRTLMQQAGDSILLFSGSGRLVEANESARQLLGYSMEEYKNMSLKDLFFEEDIKQNPLRFDLLNKGESTVNRRRLKRKGGTALETEIHAKKLSDGHYLGVGRDLTERIKAEEQLRESEEKYRTLVEHASDGIVITGTNGICIDANSTICHMLGYTKEELCNRNLFELLIIKKSDVPLRIGEILAGKSVLQERNVLKKDGTILSAELNSKLLPDNRMLVIVRDITERRQIEDALRQSNERNDIVAKATSDVVWDWDLVTGKVYRSKEGLKKVYGYDDNAPIELVANWNQRVHPDDRKMMNKVIEEIHKSPDQTTFSEEYRFLRQDGTYANIFDRGYIIRDEHGKPVRMIGAAQNITEWKTAEEKIRTSKEQYRDLVDNITDLICTHDLDGRVLSVNKAAEKLIGYKFNPEANLNIKDILTDDTKNKFNRYIAAIQKKGHVKGLMKVQTHTGDIRIWEYNNSLKTTGVETPIVRGYARDITERKKTEDLVKKQKEQYDDLVKNIPVGVYKFRMKPDGGMSLDYVSPRLCKMIGVKEEDAYRDIMNAFKVVHPDDFSRFMKLIEESYTTKQKFLWEGRSIVNGQVNWVKIESSPKVLKNGDILWDGVIADITERKKAEEIIRINEVRLTKAQQIGKLGYWQQEINSNMIWGSEEAKKIYGFPPVAGELASETIAACIPDFDKLRQAAIELLKYEKKYEIEFQINPADGSPPRYISAVSEIEKNEQGIPVRFMGVLQDITERKKAQKALEESEYLLRESQSIAHLGSYTWDLSTGLWSSSKILDYIFGIDENYTRSFKGWMALIHLDWSEMMLKYVTEEVLGKHLRFDKEYKITRNDNGEECWVHGLGELEYDNNKQPIKLIGTISDITERKRAEEALITSELRFRILTGNAPTGIFQTDAHGKNTYVNETWMGFTGMTFDEAMGDGWIAAIHPDDRQKLIKEWNEKSEKGLESSSEHRLIHKNGNFIWVSGKAVPLFNTSGEFAGYIGTISDVTDRKKAEQELAESYKAIRKLTEHLQNIREEERAHIAREIHDELGQQLTVMKMDISWINKKIGIQDEPVKARMKELLAMLDQTVKSVRRISSELRPSLLDDLGLTATMEWQLTEFEKRFDIKTYFKPDDAEIKLSESMKTTLFRIFQESLTNVARHSKAKKVTVSLSLHNSSIVLSVVDNGVGFDKQNSIGKKTLGILGMQERTSMIGGTYEISGKPGKGTKVVVRIPLADNNKNLLA